MAEEVQPQEKVAFANRKYSNEERIKKEEEELAELIAEQKGEPETEEVEAEPTNAEEKSLRSYDRKSLDVDIQNENKKRDMKEAIAKAETKVKRDAEIKSQQELFAKLAADKAAADKRNEQLAKEVEAANLNKDVYNVSNPNVKDVEIAEAVAAEGKPAAGIPTVGGPAGSNAYTGGPDGYSGTGPDGYSGGDANSGGDFSGADFGGSFGYFNQGGLAGKKPKKKMKTYKKGGLATSKK